MGENSLQSIYAVLGHPAAVDPTQYMLEKATAEQRADCQILTFDVLPENLGDAIRGVRALGFAGFICGEPFKHAVIPHLTKTTETAGLAGVVNFVTLEGGDLVGDNTQGRAFCELLKQAIDLTGKHVVLLGADRAAWPVAIELARAKPERITVVHGPDENALQLVGLLSGVLQTQASAVAWDGDYAIPADCQVLIQATSIGREDPDARVPVAVASLRSDLVVADLVFNPPHTRLWRDATDADCTTIDGLDVFVRQTTLILQSWMGLEPDAALLRDAVEEYLLL